MKNKDLNTKTIEELKNLAKEAQENLFSLNMEKAQNKLKNLKSIFVKRKEIARILTKIKEKELNNE